MKNLQQKTKETKKKIDLKGTPVFENVKPMLSTPLEITRDKLRMMNMIDENIIIHDSVIKQDCE
ncbi:hypothetical protein HNP38_003649 [Chryseobacterium defluvii]|uniref:Uncharacterized protein n=1 Tax=Chryseobacterium defluvii TaxID=160396 RepID=A0A840KK67_9FLAO|nr:hypothetical protein [Chryseobacterium defluvii]MBB4808307.1 hypothetical protein [Chryseobacterium defluvii]